MLINLTEYFEGFKNEAEIYVPFTKDSLDNGYVKMPVESVSECRLSFSKVEDGKLKAEGSASAIVLVPCDRCLKEVKVADKTEFEYLIQKPGTSDDSESDYDYFVNGYELDTDALINNELIMSLPMKVLCSETCKGLCPVCGKDLNEGECGCDTFVPDPRMAAISDIFNAIKEV